VICLSFDFDEHDFAGLWIPTKEIRPAALADFPTSGLRTLGELNLRLIRME
jgi:hypothetical protein